MLIVKSKNIDCKKFFRKGDVIVLSFDEKIILIN